MAGSNPFVGGKGLFTSTDPMSALRAQPPPTWAAVMPQYMTADVAAAYKQAGIALVIWEPSASQAGVDAVHQYGAAGYIAQAEGQGQLDAANAVAGQLGDTPHALVTNNFMAQYPPGWIAMPEAYTNNNPQATADQVTRDAQARGATQVVPVIGLGFVDTPDGRHMSAAEYQAGLDAAGTAGAVGSAAYIADQASNEDLSAYTSGKTPGGVPPEPGGAAPTPTPAPASPETPVPPKPPPIPPPAPISPITVSGTPTNPIFGGPRELPSNPILPRPPQGQALGGGQFAEGQPGENAQLGWNQPPPDRSGTFTTANEPPAPPWQNPDVASRFHPEAAAPKSTGPRPGEVAVAPSLYLDPAAITRFLNLGAPPPPPPAPPYHYGF